MVLDNVIILVSKKTAKISARVSFSVFTGNEVGSWLISLLESLSLRSPSLKKKKKVMWWPIVKPDTVINGIFICCISLGFV